MTADRRFSVEHELIDARAALTRAEDEVTRLRGYVASLVDERTALYRACADVTFTDATERIDRALADPDMAAKVAAVHKEMLGGGAL